MIKKIFFLFLLAILSFNSYSQIIFEKGWFIDEGGKRLECYIKNIDWKNNPTEFEYKLSQNSEINKAILQNIKEFGV